jgi:hypothetical protein
MLCFFLGFILSLLSHGAVNTVNDPIQDTKNIYRVITIPIDTTIVDSDCLDCGYTADGEYIENLNMYGSN